MPGKPHRHQWRYPRASSRRGQGTVRVCTQCLLQQVYRGGRWTQLEVK